MNDMERKIMRASWLYNRNCFSCKQLICTDRSPEKGVSEEVKILQLLQPALLLPLMMPCSLQVVGLDGL